MLQSYSVRTGSNLEWLVFRSSDEIQYYIIVNSSESSSGSVYIEWGDFSESIQQDSSDTGYLSDNESIEIFEVYLNQTSQYDFQLEIHVGADYGLYLYRLDEGETIDFGGSLAKSIITEIEINEKIMNYLPPATDKYVLLVMR
ncbi:MAG: hypothetical protein ACFFD2_23940, partial [Promethearchaeota archaeon]